MSSMALLLVLSLLMVSPPRTLAADHQRPQPILVRVTKDPSTSLYTASVKNGEPLVLDLFGPLLWSTYASGHRTTACHLGACKVANRNHPPSCPSAPPTTDGPCTCTAYPYNPVSRQCGHGDVTFFELSANATDGKTPLFPVSFSPLGLCAEGGLLSSLPSGAAGLAGLSRSPLSLPSRASRLKLAKEFALCLPRSGVGAAIFGGGPFQLQAAPPVELAEGLRQNPLPLLPRSNGAYYFRVNGIAINQQLVDLPTPSAFDLDGRRGKGAMLSIVTPYTTLRYDIYPTIIKAFDAATSGIARAAPVKPFELCYQASALVQTRVGFGVAPIDLMLDGGRNWTLFGASSLVPVKEQTVCFAFVETKDDDAAAVVVGGFQMEDHLLLFDLEKGTWGVSGLLPGIRTTCSNFNFGSS